MSATYGERLNGLSYIGEGACQPAFSSFFNLLVSNFQVKPKNMQTNTDVWFLNELLTSPRFWSVIRKFVRLNQEQFGRELGVSRNAVSSWETETSTPSRQHTLKAQVILERHLQATLAQMREKLEGELQAAAT